VHETEQADRAVPARRSQADPKDMGVWHPVERQPHCNQGDGRVRGLSVAEKTMCPPCDTGDTGVDGSAPCPFCGCRDHVKEIMTANPRVHTVHQCLKCGHWFDDRGPACPRCGSPGELLGNVDAPGCGMYAQYRCCECGHGFILRMNCDGDTCQT
jgi:DNA-directed RNA polymerase subunit RPC12/RpoP